MARKVKSEVFTEVDVAEEVEARVKDRLDSWSPPFFRHPMSRVPSVCVVDGDSMTHQAHAESCDINNIIRQFDRTGLLPPPTRQGQYGDVSELNRPLSELIDSSRSTFASVDRELLDRRASELASQSPKDAIPVTPEATPSVSSPVVSPPAGG